MCYKQKCKVVSLNLAHPVGLYPELRSWMRMLMSLCLLPAFAIPSRWSGMSFSFRQLEAQMLTRKSNHWCSTSTAHGSRVTFHLLYGLTSTTVDLVLPTWLRVSNFPQRPQLQVRDAASFDENFSGLVAEMPVWATVQRDAACRWANTETAHVVVCEERFCDCLRKTALQS